MRKEWSPGDWVIYRKSKRSTSPGPRASKVVASEKGELYTYVVDKFWVVQGLLPDDRLLLRTAKGKTHVMEASDRNLRRPSWLERLMWRGRFREVEAALAADAALEQDSALDGDGDPITPQRRNAS